MKKLILILMVGNFFMGCMPPKLAVPLTKEQMSHQIIFNTALSSSDFRISMQRLLDQSNQVTNVLDKNITLRKECRHRVRIFDETNDERGWINGTSSGYDDFKYDFKFSKIYLLNKNSFNKIKLKGQKTFFELKLGFKNEDLFKQIDTEIEFIKRYIQPIICSF